MTKIARAALTRRSLLAGASAGLISSRVWAQQPSEVKVGLLVPISGLYARPGAVMRHGAEMGVEHINAQGGIKSLGGAKLKLSFSIPATPRRKPRTRHSAWSPRKPTWWQQAAPI